MPFHCEWTGNLLQDNIKGGIKASVPASAKISCVRLLSLPQKEREGFVFTADCRDTEMVVSQWCCGEAGQAVIKLHRV